MFEAVCAKFRDRDGDNVLCSCVYRPENSKDAFFAEFDEFIGSIFIKFQKIIICGDFNIHLDLPNLTDSTKFMNIISSYGLKQLVTGLLT